MFCSKCGMQLSDDAAFCPSCGTLQGSQPAAQTIEQPMAQPAASMGKKASLSKKVKMLLLGGVALVAILAVVLLLFMGGPGYGSPEELAVNFVESFFSDDLERQMNCLPDWALRESAASMGFSPNLSRSELLDAVEIYLENQQKDEDYIPIERKVQILNVSIANYLHRNDIDLDDYELTSDEYLSITKGAKVEIDCMLNEMHEKIYIICVESNGKWFFWDTN